MIRELVFEPFLGIYLLASILVLAIIFTLLRVRRYPLGTLIRILTILLIGCFLLQPMLKVTEGEVLPDIAVILEDQSRSLEFGNRNEISSSVSDRLETELDERGFEVRRLSFGSSTETNFAAALRENLSEIPRRRLSGLFAVTDGQFHHHDDLILPSMDVPIHGILAGDASTQTDRRIEIVEAPRFGVVGEIVTVTLRVLSPNETGLVPTTLFVGGEEYARQELEIGEDVSLSVRLQQPGDTILELVVDSKPDELSVLNNRAVTPLTAVRDRLRVLLISGEPHAGERVWRNLLKSDPAVDLVHFTILKPANKPMTARREDLNLIEFPHEELFLDKLPSFDVVIFDRYTYRGVLQSYEFEAIARYVENGGALLVAAGPELTQRGSITSQPNLSYILPISPSGEIREEAFVPARSTIGTRHPITAGLEDTQDWGRWLRYLPGQINDGEVLLEAPDEVPLLIVSRVQQGRIALMMSDHVWLWARGFDGGGPHQELLRRLVHWLMKEPALEEESLHGQISENGKLIVSRQTLASTVEGVEITNPDGQKETIQLTSTEPGIFVGEAQAQLPGLYRLQSQTTDGETLYALAATNEGPLKELGALETTADYISPIATSTGGGVWTMGAAQSSLPQIRHVSASQSQNGTNWAGLIKKEVRSVQSVRMVALLPNFIWLALIFGGIILAWLLEGRRLSVKA